MSTRLIGALALALGAFAAPVSAQKALTASGTTTISAAAVRAENLVFTQAVPRLVVAQTFQMAVGQISDRRTVVPIHGAIWSSSEPQVVAVNETGLTTGLREGKSVITATYNGQAVRVRVSVAAATSTAPVATLEITPVVDSIDINGSRQYTHTARSSDGLVITTAPVTYSTKDTSIAQISADGLLWARRSGTTGIVATSGTVSVTAQMHVRAPVVTSLTVLPAPMTVTAGDSSEVTVSATRSDGTRIDPAQLTVKALRGKVSGGRYVAPTTAGADTIVVSAADGTTLSSPVLVMAPTTTSTPAVGAPASRITLALTRFDGGSGNVLVSSGVPLAPSQLRLADVAKLRLVVNGNEVPARITALKGLHRDGSLRSVLLQATVAIGSTPVAAELQLGVAPTLSAPAAVTPVAKPAAMALPTGEHLRASMIVGATRSIDSTSLSGYDSKFRQHADEQWALYGADWGNVNYYDRVLNHVAFWARGGEPVYMRRALDMAVDYREKYLVASDYLPSPHWSQLEGLAVHYWLTGDENSRTTVLKTAQRLTDTFQASYMLDPNFEYNDGRIQSRALMASSLAVVLEGDALFRTRAAGYVHAMVTNILPDGSYFWKGWNGQGNFMVALQNDAMIKYLEWVADDSRIAPTIKKSLDFLWSTQWLTAGQAFRYGSSGTTADAIAPAPDLNMFFVGAYAWYGKHSGDTSYRTKADAIALGAIAGAWLNGTKQFNQFFYSSHNYLAYRR
ncbi:MAG: hypothetical protein V4813_11105 [Gemmatimonadota bacterium]